MNFFKLIPVYISGLLLAAHFFRAGMQPLALLALFFPWLLLLRRAWVARLVQGLLLWGALEWVRTLLDLVAMRRAMGSPWLRLVVILGTVALFTGASAMLFLCRSLRERYHLDPPQEAPPAAE